MRQTNLLSIGDSIQPGTYELHSRFNRVVNFTNHGTLVSVVHKEIGAGPINIVVENLTLDGIGAIEIENHSVIIVGSSYDFKEDRIFYSYLDFESADVDKVTKNFAFLNKALIATSHPKSLTFLLDPDRVENFQSTFEKAFVEKILTGVRKMTAGDVTGGVETVHGCGFGLTPSGDDFIAGLLYGLHFSRRVFGNDCQKLIDDIYAACKRGNIFSKTFLYLAKEGAFFEKLKKLITALIDSREKEIRLCTERLFSVGETSGADLMTGFWAALQTEVFGIGKSS
ncbi:MAG: DUF2877 domain-containing protein [bacterium]